MSLAFAVGFGIGFAGELSVTSMGPSGSNVNASRFLLDGEVGFAHYSLY